MHRTKCSVRGIQCRFSFLQKQPVSRTLADQRINQLQHGLKAVNCYTTKSFPRIFQREQVVPNVREEDKLLIASALKNNKPTVSPTVHIYAKVSSLTSGYKILDLVNTGQLDEAEAYWNDLKSKIGQPGGLPQITTEIYEQVIKMYGKMGKMQELQMAWQEMQDNGIIPTEKLYCAFILALSTQKMMTEAEDVCKVMKEANIQKTHFTYHAMIKGYLDIREPKLADEWYKKMLEENLPANEVTYNIFMSYMKDIGRTQNVFTLFRQMKAENINPTQRTYAVLLQAHAKDEKLDEMLATFKDMKKKLSPNRVLYNIVLSALAKAGLVTNMTALFREMKEDYSIKPTAKDYLAVISGYGKKGQIAEMQKAFDEMLRFGVKPIPSVMNAMIDAAGKHGTMKMVEDYMKLMTDLTIQFDAVTYEVLLQIYSRSGDTEMMEKIFEAMKSLAPKRTSHAYHTVISHLATIKEYKKAVEYYEQMKEEGLEPWLVTDANIMKCFLQQDDKIKFKDILKKYAEDKELVSDIGTAFLSLYPFAERNLTQRIFDQFVKKILEKNKTQNEEK